MSGPQDPEEPSMTAHDHRSYVEGCYRCELGRDEVTDPVTRQQVLDACAEVMSPHAVEFWMRSTNRLLDHASPDELIERGEGERALALLAALAEGVIL